MFAWVCAAACGVTLHLYPADLEGYSYNLNLNGKLFVTGLNDRQAHGVSHRFWSNAEFDCKNIGHGK